MRRLRSRRPNGGVAASAVPQKEQRAVASGVASMHGPTVALHDAVDIVRRRHRRAEEVEDDPVRRVLLHRTPEAHGAAIGEILTALTSLGRATSRASRAFCAGCR